MNYSEKFDKYYIGQTEKFEYRILLHNAGLVKSTNPYITTKAMKTYSMTLASKDYSKLKPAYRSYFKGCSFVNG